MNKTVLIIGLILAGIVNSPAEAIWKRCDVASTTGNYGWYPDAAASVKVGVWPVAAGHSVGAVWSADGWHSIHWATGRWCWNEPSPTGSGQWDENWRIAWSSPNDGATSFQYSIFVEDSRGNITWDNNNGWNYDVAIEPRRLRAEYLWNCNPSGCD